MKLFVLGNGFDLHHGLNTKYSDFRQYLKDNHYDDYLLINSELCDPSDEEILWSNLEDTLGRTSVIDVNCKYNEICAKLIDKKDEEKKAIIYYELEKLSKPRRLLSELMLKWIEYVEKTETPQKKQYIKINEEDYCLIFNYTCGSISLYESIKTSNIDKFCYIHNNYLGEQVFVGHNTCFDTLDHEEYSPVLFRENYITINEEHEKWDNMLKRGLNEINHILFKNPIHKIQQKEGFFENISVVDEVVIMGWSLGSCDWPYMDMILKSVKDDIKIVIVHYDDNALLNYQDYFKKHNCASADITYMTWKEYELENI